MDIEKKIEKLTKDIIGFLKNKGEKPDVCISALARALVATEQGSVIYADCCGGDINDVISKTNELNCKIEANFVEFADDVLKSKEQ